MLKQTTPKSNNTLVQPVFDNTSFVLDPHMQTDIDKVQPVNEEEPDIYSRFHNTSNPPEMLSDLDWESLATRRSKIKQCI